MVGVTEVDVRVRGNHPTEIEEGSVFVWIQFCSDGSEPVLVHLPSFLNLIEVYSVLECRKVLSRALG